MTVSDNKLTNFLKFISVLLVMTMLAFLCGCTQGSAPKSGIEIIPKEDSYEYADEAEAYAKSVMHSFLYSLETKNGTEKISAKRAEEIKKNAEKVYALLPNTLTPNEHMQFYKILAQHTSKIADGINMLLSGDVKTGFERLEEPYLDFSSEHYKEFLATAVYNIACNDYEEKYQAQIDSYELYGKDYMLDIALRYKERKSVLEGDIGVKGIEQLIEHFFIIGDLFYGNALESSTLSGFTNEEILLFMEAINLGELEITEKGYELLLQTYAEAAIVNQNKTFFEKVIFAASQNGDITSFSAFVKEIAFLVGDAQSSLSSEDVELLREGKMSDFLCRCIENFDESDWARFDEICNLEIRRDEYTALAVSYYGDDFSAYMDTLSVKTIEELKLSVGKDNFNQTLKEYIAGICPAFSYGMNF